MGGGGAPLGLDNAGSGGAHTVPRACLQGPGGVQRSRSQLPWWSLPASLMRPLEGHQCL